VYYETMDSEHRPFKLWRHEMGTPMDQDALLYTEEDQRFWYTHITPQTITDYWGGRWDFVQGQRRRAQPGFGGGVRQSH
jgi:hypothetical protein